MFGDSGANIGPTATCQMGSIITIQDLQLAPTLHTISFFAVGFDPAHCPSQLAPTLQAHYSSQLALTLHIVLRSWLRPCTLLIAIGFGLASIIITAVGYDPSWL